MKSAPTTAKVSSACTPRKRNGFLRTASASLAALALAVTGLPAMADNAQAATKAYEFTGTWLDQPDVVRSGIDVLGTEWKFDVNDDTAAPSNDPVPNNVLTVTLENAKFTELPSTCLTESPDASGNEVTPLSSVSEDGRTLECNLGTRVQGTAELAFAGVLTDGPAGEYVGATGTFRDHEVELPKIPITNEFGMDAKFDGGGPQSFTGDSPSINRYNDQFIDYPFSVSHRRGTPAGPDSVTYELTIEHTGQSSNPEVQLRDVACVPNDRIQSGYPYSDDAHDANMSTRFPECSLTKTGAKTFELTLSGLDYSNGPQLDSNEQPLPLANDVIAAGKLQLRVPYVNNGGQVSLEASAPTYTAEDGQTTEDDPTNNSNAVPIVRGGWTGGWAVAAQRPEAYPGSPWTDTSRAPAGATVMSVGAVRVRDYPGSPDTWVCKVLDTDHVTFKSARLGLKADAQNGLYYDDSYQGDFWYYTGDFVDAHTGEPVDPNEFECGTDIDPNDPAAGNPEGWSTTPPADLSQVKAVKVQVSKDVAAEATAPLGMVYLVIDQVIKPDTPVGTDIWTWTTPVSQGGTEWDVPRTSYASLDRSDNPKDVNPYGKVTPDLTYAYAGPGRDVLRVVGSEPIVEKSVAQNEYAPGQEVDYTVRYGLESNLADPAADQVVVEDTLPKGMTYVAGSASPEPEVSGDAANGQKLTWTFDEVQPNDELGEIQFRALLPEDAKPGSVQVNNVTATSQEITRKATAQFIVPNSGYTTLLKKTEHDRLLVGDDGNVSNSWTLTLESRDPNVSQRTDLIDILPYVGDERGTEFGGDLKLDEVQAPEGATVYYTTADPATINEDPNDASNGAFGAPSDIWSTEYTADATAFRVIGGPLHFGDQQQLALKVTLTEAKPGEKVVNTAVARAESTEMRMRTSAQFEVYSDEEPTTPPTDPTTPPTEPTTPPTEPTTPPTEPGETPSEPGETPIEPGNPTAPSESEEPGTGLATTGADGMLPLAWFAGALLVAGGIVVAAQRRKESHQ